MGLLGNISGALSGSTDAFLSKIRGPAEAAEYVGEDFSEGFIISEFSASGGKVENTFILRGNLMPHIPFKFGGTQKLVKEYYPGNSEPTVHVMGAREDNVKINGRWSDRKIKDLDLRGVATALQEEFDKIRIRGNLLELRLGEWKRYGFLEASHFDLRTLADIEWELDFLIVGFNKPTNDHFAESGAGIPSAENAALIKAADEFNTPSLPTTLPTSVGLEITKAISTVAASVNLVTNFVSAVIETAEDAQKNVERALGLIRNARASIAAFKRRVGALALYVGTNPLKTAAGIASEVKRASNAQAILAVLHSTSTSRVKNTSSIEAILTRMEAQFKALRRSTPKFRHLVKEGETLEQLSVKFYGQAGGWKRIYDHNKLLSTSLPAGKLLEIPEL